MENHAKKRWVGITLTAAVAVLVAFFAGYRSSPSRPLGPSPQPASAAPPLALPDLNGKTVRLSDFRGKVVLLDFWATWCEPCVEEVPELKAFHEKYDPRGFTVLGVSMDENDPKGVAAFVRERRIPYPVLLANGDPGPDYPVRAIPYALLIDRGGRIVNEYVGFKFIDEIERDVKPLLDQKI